LVEDFVEDEDWRVGEEVKKEIRVTNIGGTEQYEGDSYGPVFARLRLREFLDVTPVHYEYFVENDESSAALFMIDREGNFVRFESDSASPTTKPALDTVKASPVWAKVFGADADSQSAFLANLTENELVLAQSFADGEPWWYVRTKAGDPNGQYGRPLATAVIDELDNRYSIIDGIERADDEDFGNNDESEACDYSVHRWDYSDDTAIFKDYVAWILGEDVVFYEDWAKNPRAVNAWILTGGDEGWWAYWGNAIAPGDSTSNLLEQVMRLKSVDGRMYYAIHTDMQSIDSTGLTTNWTGNSDKTDDIPADILAVLTGSVRKISKILLNPKLKTLSSHPTKSVTKDFSATTTGEGELLWNVAGDPANINLKLEEITAGDDRTRRLTVPFGYSGSVTVTVSSADGSVSDAVTFTVSPALAPVELKPPYDEKPEWRPVDPSVDEFTLDRIFARYEGGAMTYDYENAEAWGVSPYIVIELADILANPVGVTLEVPLDQALNPRGYTAADIYIENGKIISKCLLTADEFLDGANFDGTYFTIEIPVTIYLHQPDHDPTPFTIVNMYNAI
jgi:hypothetical protein